MTELIRVFGRIGLLSFGGPAAQIALMHKELVEDRDWLSEAQFLRALSFCMLLPGPEAMQLATYAGWRQRGIAGGLIAGGLFILPGALIIAGLALAYGRYGDLGLVQALFLGIKAAVVVIVLQALWRIAGRALKTSLHWLLAGAGFLALFVFALPFPLVIALAGLVGAGMAAPGQTDMANPARIGRPVRIIAIGAIIWLAPLGLIFSLGYPFLADVGTFFATLAVVTFGGAYAVLAYMTQEIVVGYGWLTTAQMMDALGLAETTPGPLILVTQFVAMIAGMAQGGPWLALVVGALCLWVTFVPSFIFIFAGAPLIDWLDSRPRLRGALAAITATVVGVMANLSLWFATHLFFDQVGQLQAGPVMMIWPAAASLNIAAILLAGLAAILLLWRKWSLPLVFVTCALAAAGVTAAAGMI